jgi:hypothetical protein
MPGVRVVLLPMPVPELAPMSVPVPVPVPAPVPALEGMVAVLPESMVEPVAGAGLVAGWFCMVEPPVLSVEGVAPPVAAPSVLLWAKASPAPVASAIAKVAEVRVFSVFMASLL